MLFEKWFMVDTTLASYECTFGLTGTYSFYILVVVGVLILGVKPITAPAYFYIK